MLFILLVSLLLLKPLKVGAVAVAGNSATMKTSQPAREDLDERYLILVSFLREKDSPLVGYAGEFIRAADKYKIDWRLMPAIAGLESSFGKRLIQGYFNPFGWAGGYYRFESWSEGIYHVGQFLREKYYDYGRDTPEKIGPVYAPPNPRWGSLVTFIMNKITP